MKPAKQTVKEQKMEHRGGRNDAMQPVVMLVIAGVAMFSVIGGVSLLSHYYTLNGIKRQDCRGRSAWNGEICHEKGNRRNLCAGAL